MSKHTLNGRRRKVIKTSGGYPRMPKKVETFKKEK